MLLKCTEQSHDIANMSSISQAIQSHKQLKLFILVLSLHQVIQSKGESVNYFIQDNNHSLASYLNS